jgi:hypothetical protein
MLLKYVIHYSDSNGISRQKQTNPGGTGTRKIKKRPTHRVDQRENSNHGQKSLVHYYIMSNKHE